MKTGSRQGVSVEHRNGIPGLIVSVIHLLGHGNNWPQLNLQIASF